MPHGSLGGPSVLQLRMFTSLRNDFLRKNMQTAEQKGHSDEIQSVGSWFWTRLVNQPETLSRFLKCLSSLKCFGPKRFISTLSFQNMSQNPEILDLEPLVFMQPPARTSRSFYAYLTITQACARTQVIWPDSCCSCLPAVFLQPHSESSQNVDGVTDLEFKAPWPYLVMT